MQYIPCIFFWGLEGVASIVATQSVVGAPTILLYNVVPHAFFIFANYVRQAATSDAFVAEREKTSLIFCQVNIDTTIHGTQLWYHIKHLYQVNYGNVESTICPNVFWTISFSSMVLLTCWVHHDEMSWSYFTASIERLCGGSSMPVRYVPIQKRPLIENSSLVSRDQKMFSCRQRRRLTLDNLDNFASNPIVQRSRLAGSRPIRRLSM